MSFESRKKGNREEVEGSGETQKRRGPFRDPKGRYEVTYVKGLGRRNIKERGPIRGRRVPGKVLKELVKTTT